MDSFGISSRGPMAVFLRSRPPLRTSQLLRQPESTAVTKAGGGLHFLSSGRFKDVSKHEIPKLPLCLPLPPWLVRGEEEGGFFKARTAKKQKGGDGTWTRTGTRNRSRKESKARGKRPL